MKRIAHLLILLLILLSLISSASADPATRVYWTEWRSYNPNLSRIARANINGSGVETILDGFQEGIGVKDLAVDSENGKLYIANRSAGLIECTNLDGTARDTLMADIHPVGLALDVAGGKMYWCDYTYNDPQICRADLDGANYEALRSASDGCVLEGIVLDLDAGYIYWAERMDQQIWRSNLDGSGAFMFLQCWEGVGHPCGLALSASRIYWSSSDGIYSANFAADDLVPLIEDLPSNPRSLEIDRESDKLYWVTGASYDGKVHSINLDGSGLQTVVAGLYYGYGLALEYGEPVGVPELTGIVTRLENHPNPFNPCTVISFDMDRAQDVRLQVHGLDGSLLGVLLDERREAGHQTVRWNGCDRDGRALPSGVYLYRLVTEQGMTSRRMTLVR